MQHKNKIDIRNIIRMREIAEIYDLTNQKEKSKKYHKSIIKLCDKTSRDEKILQLKIASLNYLNKSYKSLETTNELLKLNPHSIDALFNIATYLKE